MTIKNIDDVCMDMLQRGLVKELSPIKTQIEFLRNHYSEEYLVKMYRENILSKYQRGDAK